METKRTKKSARASRIKPTLSYSDNGLTYFPPHFKTPVEVCGPCINGKRYCITTRFTWKCIEVVAGHTSGLGIEVPPIWVCGWEMEIVNVRTEKCIEVDKPAKQVFLPSLKI